MKWLKQGFSIDRSADKKPPRVRDFKKYLVTF